jgi:hypothetical protein
MSVAIHPGQTAFTRIPLLLSSAASTRVSGEEAPDVEVLDAVLAVDIMLRRTLAEAIHSRRLR